MLQNRLTGQQCSVSSRDTSAAIVAYVTMLCHHGTMLFHHFTMSSSNDVTMPSCHYVIHVIHVRMSCHHVIMSPCRHDTMSPCQQGFWLDVVYGSWLDVACCFWMDVVYDCWLDVVYDCWLDVIWHGNCQVFFPVSRSCHSKVLLERT